MKYFTHNKQTVGFMRSISVFIFVLMLSVTALSDVVRDGSFQATSDGSNVTLRWITEDESSVARFEIEKRSGTDGEYKMIASVEPRNLSIYEFVDYSAMSKTSSLYQYRIKVVFTNGANPLYVGPVTVTHSVSGVRKTWGSIKALFR